MRENPVIPDWVHVLGGNTEGMLGGWLAQRQAALRGLLAAGARSLFPLRLFRACRRALEHFVCQKTQNSWNRKAIGFRRASFGASGAKQVFCIGAYHSQRTRNDTTFV